MKKVIAILSSISMLLSLCACGSSTPLKVFDIEKLRGITDINKALELYGEPNSKEYNIAITDYDYCYEDISFLNKTGNFEFHRENGEVDFYEFSIQFGEFSSDNDERNTYFEQCKDYVAKEYGPCYEEDNSDPDFTHSQWKVDDKESILVVMNDSLRQVEIIYYPVCDRYS